MRSFLSKVVTISIVVSACLLPRPVIGQTHFSKCAKRTGDNATFLIPGDMELKIEDSRLSKRDEIAVFTTEGTCAGVAVWNKGNFVLTAWGDDLMTPDKKEGFVEGEAIMFRIWDASSSREYGGDDAALSATFTTRIPSKMRGVYAANAVYELKALAPVETPPEPFLEANTVTIPTGKNDRWHPVDLLGTYKNPVIVMGSPDHVRQRDTFVRVGNVTESGFEFLLEEGGRTEGGRISRTISYIVAEEGSYRLGDGILVEAGSVTTSNSTATVRLRGRFSSPPIVLSQVISSDEHGFVTAGQSDIRRDGFKLHLQGAQTQSTIEPQTVAYIAFEPGTRSTSRAEYEVGRVNSRFATGAFHSVEFSADFDAPPAVIAAMQSANRESASSIRQRNRTSESFDVLVDEPRSRRAKSGAIGYAAFAAGRVSGNSRKRRRGAESRVENVVPEAAKMGLSAGPHETSLDAIYPNPFNPSTSIRFGLAADEHVRIDVFDLTGRHVATLVDQVLDAGWHVSTFDGTGLASGIYFCRLETPSLRTTAKMVMLK